MTSTLRSTDLSNLTLVAREIIECAGDLRVCTFSGEMGAGKTTLIKEVARTLGVTDPISSPTFSIVNEYRRSNGEPLYHFDLYRIEHISELYEMGYEEYFYSGYYCLIEWPEKAESLIPEGHLAIKIRVENNSRFITFK